jgi:CRP-like cAMP-binding protein
MQGAGAHPYDAGATVQREVPCPDEVELFRKCSQKELQKIASIADEASLEKGTVLCQQDKIAQQCFVIVDGKAKVEIDGKEIAVVGPGQAVGEMALLNRKPRVATVRATTPMTVYVIHHAQFRALLEDASTVAIRLLENLSERLRELERRPAQH